MGGNVFGGNCLGHVVIFLKRYGLKLFGRELFGPDSSSTFVEAEVYFPKVGQKGPKRPHPYCVIYMRFCCIRKIFQRFACAELSLNLNGRTKFCFLGLLVAFTYLMPKVFAHTVFVFVLFDLIQQT